MRNDVVPEIIYAFEEVATAIVALAFKREGKTAEALHETAARATRAARITSGDQQDLMIVEKEAEAISADLADLCDQFVKDADDQGERFTRIAIGHMDEALVLLRDAMA